MEINTQQDWDRHQAEMNAQAAADVKMAGTLSAKTNRLLALMTANNADNLNGQLDAQIAALRAEIAAQEKAENVAKTTWTREQTITRRAQWNEMVRSGKFLVNGRIIPTKVYAQEVAQGWSTNTLKMAIEAHGL